MIILILLALLAVDIFTIKAVKNDDSTIGVIADAIGSISLIIVAGTLFFSIIALILVHLPNSREKELCKYQQRYEVITYALQDDSSYVAVLVDDIADYNSDVLNGRREQDNFWLGAFEYDFYYDLDLIELGEGANEEV